MERDRRLVAAASGEVLVPELEATETRWEALKGLLGRDGLAPGQGLLIRRCASVHTAFMRFPLDLVYLDREYVVRRLVAALAPWRASACLGAAHVVELPAGALAGGGFRVGLAVAVVPRSGPAPER
jgi:uncharacterized membrane protein (UPF0127 family)